MPDVLIGPELKATVGIEPTNKAFAEPCLTTWLRRQERAKGFEPLTFSLARRHSTAELSPQTTGIILHFKNLTTQKPSIELKLKYSVRQLAR
jgi:hypothetical protein